MSRRPLRIIALGMMGQSPFGGQAWMHLHWLLGLHHLGHEVWYIEDSAAWPYHPVQNRLTNDCQYAVDHVARAMEQIGLENRWAYRLAERPQECWGLTAKKVDELYATCDLLLNITGGTILREEHLAAPLRVYLETDPVTAELRLAAGEVFARECFDAHHRVATYGENYGAADCRVPLGDLKIVKTRQPIDLAYWPACETPDARFFTTIGNYRQQGCDIEYDGETYRWSKHHEWEKVIDLPRLTDQDFELAVMINEPGDRETLEGHGWHVISPFRMSLDVFGAYPRYIRQSRAEFTVAKDQNVRLRSGWFSERDVCYLASGKPVVTQDTGFGKYLPTGRGLFAFRAVEEAAAAIEEINRDYRAHCQRARQIAEEQFECRQVARRLLRDIGLA